MKFKYKDKVKGIGGEFYRDEVFTVLDFSLGDYRPDTDTWSITYELELDGRRFLNITEEGLELYKLNQTPEPDYS